MIRVYKSIEDFKIDYPNLDLLQNALVSAEGDYNLLVTKTTVPASVERNFVKHQRLAPNDDTLSFLRRNRNAKMEVLEPFLKDDIDSYGKSVGIEMLKFMGRIGDVNLVFHEIPIQYIKYLVEVIKLSLPDTKFCYEVTTSDTNDHLDETKDRALATEPRDALLQEALAQEDLDEEDLFIEQEG